MTRSIVSRRTMPSSRRSPFKLMTDPYVGQLTFIRVYSGVLKSGDTVYNPIKSRKERIGRVLQMRQQPREIKGSAGGRHRRLRRLERRSPPARRSAIRMM